LLCEENIVAKFKEVKTGRYKSGRIFQGRLWLKMAVLRMMMMI
jgi:hypothetical protein